MFNSYNYKDVLTRASLTIQIIDDTTLYKASIFSANGNIFNINDKSSQISLLVQKGIEDITDQFTDIVWSRFHYKSGQYEEDLEWGKQHYGKKTFILHRDDILEKANIQVSVYAQIDGVKTLVAADYISFTDINDMQGSEIPPTSPKHGDLWLDISVTPPRLMMWNDTLKKWVEVVMSGSDKRNLIRNSNFYKNSFDFWLKVGNPTLKIESLSGKKWARLLCDNTTAINNGISQIVSAIPKSNYSFQMICRTYTQSQFPNGDVLVSAYSINNDSQKTLLKEIVFDINNEIKNYNFSFSSLQDTERIEIIISNNLNQQCDIILTNTKLEKSSIPNEWEIAIEDIQDALNNKVGNSPEEVFDSLTDGGKMQGVYVDVDENGNKNYYFNASYIKSGYIYGERIDAKNLLVRRRDGIETLKIDEYGNVSLKGNIQFEADGGFVDPATKEDIGNAVNKLQINDRNFILKSDTYITEGRDVTTCSISDDFIARYNENKGKKIITSLEITANNAISTNTSGNKRVGVETTVEFTDGTHGYIGCWQQLSDVPLNCDKKRISYEQIVSNKDVKNVISVGLHVQGITSGTIKIGKPQTIISDKDFDWSKAQEDIDKEISNKLNNNSQEIWDKVTDEGVKQGLFSKDGNVYINGEFVNAKNLRVQDTSGNLTFGIDSNGNITIKPTSFSLTPSTYNQSTMINALNNNTNSDNDTNGIYLSNGKIYFNGENIKANSINGHTITGSTLKGGTIGIGGTAYDSFTVDVNGNVKISKGSININSGKFIVDSNGNLTTAGSVNVGNKFKIATDGSATIDNMTATNLTVNTGLFKGSINVNNKFSVDNSGNLSINGGVFSVTNTGALTAKSGKIAGYNITGNQLIGSKVGMSGLNGEGLAFWAGNDTPANASFKVDHAGNLTATNANIKGNISGSIINGSELISEKKDGLSSYKVNVMGASLSSFIKKYYTSEGQANDDGYEYDKLNILGGNISLENGYSPGNANPNLLFLSPTNMYMRNGVSGDYIIKVEGYNDSGYNVNFESSVNVTGKFKIGNGMLLSGVLSSDNSIEIGSGHIRIPNSSSALQAKDTSGTYRNLAYISGNDNSYFGKGLYDAGIGGTIICGNIMYLRSKDRILFQCGGNTNATNSNSIEFTSISSNGYFRPTVTDVTRLGSASQLWNILYSKNGVNQSSDRNLKENIRYIDNEVPNKAAITNNVLNKNGITSKDLYDFVNKELYLAEYNFIGEKNDKIGFIAQDILYNQDGTDNKVGQIIINMKEAVTEDSFLSYNESNYINVLAGALKQAIKEIEALKQEVVNLKST